MFGIIPRDTGFFDLFDRAAQTLAGSAEAYDALLANGSDRGAQLKVIRDFEHEGDRIVRDTLGKLDRTFVTPFDREDIQILMRRIDDVIDELDAASKRYVMYKIPAPTEWLLRQSKVLTDACRVLGRSIPHLRSLMRRPEELRAHLHEVQNLEKVGDDIHHAAIVDLYDQGGDAILAMKWKEIYDLTERAIDRCEDVANIIGVIALKNA